MNENTFQNCVTFNGTLEDNPVDVGGGYLAFKLKEEFPTILIQSTIEESKKNFLEKDAKISAFGTLKNVGGDWVIFCIQLSKR